VKTKTKIMIVEDEMIVGADIQSRLTQFGYDVSEVIPTGEEAVDQAWQFHPDVILMDIKLAGVIDGIEAAARIRSAEEVPIIFLSAYTERKLLERARLSEPYAYIVKPYKDEELRMAIELAVYKREVEKERKRAEEERERLIRELQIGRAHV